MTAGKRSLKKGKGEKMATFNLESSMADRVNFDDMIRRDAEGMLATLTFYSGREDDAWHQDPDQYVKVAWESFEIQVEHDFIIVDDMAEAKARYEAVFPQAVRDWQKLQMVDHLEEEMSTEEKGYVTAIEISPGGHQDGLDYGPVVIDIVTLEADGAVIAYRQSDDGQDGDWQLGGIEDAVDEVLGVREQLAATEEEIAEMSAQAEVLAALG